MYHSTLNYLQKIPLSELIEDQILNFSTNPWDHLSHSDGWKSSESEEENDSVSSDQFSIQSPVSPGSRNSSNSNITCNECNSIELNTGELKPDKKSCQLTLELNVALLRIKELEDKFQLPPLSYKKFLSTNKYSANLLKNKF